MSDSDLPILDAQSTLTDVAFAVSTALERINEPVVLCGGSAATYYAPEAYESRDLDFVITFGARPREVNAALQPLGYVRKPEGLYAHRSIVYTIDLLPGPVAIDQETITTFNTERRGEQLLRVLTPTDVVRDRVLTFWAWGDQRALRVAVAVAHARSADFDFAFFEEWTNKLAGSFGYDRARQAVILSSLQ